MNQYEAVLKYLSVMDTEMLELILPDENLYQGVKKSTFIHEYAEIKNGNSASPDPVWA